MKTVKFDTSLYSPEIKRGKTKLTGNGGSNAENSKSVLKYCRIADKHGVNTRTA